MRTASCVFIYIAPGYCCCLWHVIVDKAETVWWGVHVDSSASLLQLLSSLHGSTETFKCILQNYNSSSRHPGNCPLGSHPLHCPSTHTQANSPLSPFLSPSALVHRRRKTETSHRLESISLPPTPPTHSTYRRKQERWITKNEPRVVVAVSAEWHDNSSLRRCEANTLGSESCCRALLILQFSDQQRSSCSFGKAGQVKKPQAGGGDVCVCLCIQFVHVLYNLLMLALLCVFMFVHAYTCVCVQTCDWVDVNLTACSYYPAILKRTNSLKPNAEHSSALESAWYVGGWNSYRDISGFD